MPVQEKIAGYTAGPWRVGDAGFTVFGPPNGTPCPKVIASLKNKADVRLIAAAPEMLALLQSAVEEIKGPDYDGTVSERTLDDMESAIAKALGR